MKHLIPLSAVCLIASAHAATPPTPDEVERRVDRVVNRLLAETAIDDHYAPAAALKDRMAYYHTPGVSIAVVNNYRIEWARGFGLKESGKRDPVTETTLFQAGSISKPIFALGVMRLVQDGKVGLDEDVNHYLTSWKVPPSGSWQPRVTLRQLLSHTGGLTVHGFPGYLRNEKLPTVVEILEGRAPANTARIEVSILPGTQVRYSGGGITVAQQLVVDVLNQPFPKIMRESVLDPLKMTHSTFEQPLPKPWARFAASAHPSKGRPVDGKWHAYPEMAAAGLWTTPSDLARAGIECQLALKGEEKGVLSTKRVIEMLTPGIDESIGIGFFLSGKEGNVRFGHGGWDEGFVAEMTMYKGAGKGAVIMLNSNEGQPLLFEIERAIAREYQWPGFFPDEKKPVKVSSDILQTYVGEYLGKPGMIYAVTSKNGTLFFQPPGQPPIELHSDAETNFWVSGLNAEISFSPTEKGDVKSLTLRQEGRTISAERKR